MLYVLHGTNTDALTAKTERFTAGLQKKRPDAELFFLTDETFEEARLDEFIKSRGLFESKYIVVLHGVLSDAQRGSAVGARLKELAESEHIFLVAEKKIPAAMLKKLEKHAEKIDAVGDEKRTEEERQTLFPLADALGARDRRELWAQTVSALARGVAPEEIHGMLFWQAKAMCLAHNAGSAAEAGMKPFPFNKTKRYVKNYSNEELHALVHTLTTLYHDAHRGEHEFDIALERFALEI